MRGWKSVRLVKLKLRVPASRIFSTPMAKTISYIPEATAKHALRKASRPVAQIFETRVMGLYEKPRASARGLPVLRSPAIQGRKEPNQAASMSLSSTLASAHASKEASIAKSLQLWLKFSPNLVHPTPIIATCSLKRPPILFPPNSRPSLPEIVRQALTIVKLTKSKLHFHANVDVLGIYI